MTTLTTRVAIIGAGPAGLLLGVALARAGIDFVIVENRSREYVLSRIRAGVLEQGSVEMLSRLGVGERLAREGLVHDGIYLQFAGERHHIDFARLIGRTVTVYGQQEVVKDLMAEHDRLGADGFHGISRQSIPASELTVFEREYPYAWLGILADVAPSTDELIYALHEDGFAMHSMRSTQVSRLYVQVDPTENIDDWSDARIWDALHTRLATPGWTLHEGEITEKSITPMRSFVASRLDYGRLFMVGDAGHIVPPTGAKGLNSAISDVTMLAQALIEHFAGSETRLTNYGAAALDRQWRTQQFSQWMTEMLHRRPGNDAASDFDYRSQLGELAYVTGSTYAQQMLAEQYTGLKLEGV